ncbi:hypothetical protein [Streptomyces sp. LN699]|uniref:hypothetical protein n=1 Tax=Streptomyces sp. LN699 TaxID=3112981 RepID=UPI00371D82BB
MAAGCGGASSDGKPAAVASVASVASSSAAPAADPQAAEKTAVLTAYDAMAAAETWSYANAVLDPELEKHATDKALADIKATLFWYQRRGTVMKGATVHSPRVGSLDTVGDTWRASITDCVDSSAHDKVDKASGKPVTAPSGPRCHVVTSTAQRTKTGPWQVYTSTIERDRTNDRARPHMLTRPRPTGLALALAAGLLLAHAAPALADGGGVVCPPRELDCDITAQDPGKPLPGKPGQRPGKTGGDGPSCAIYGTPVPCSTPDMGVLSLTDSCY